MAVVSSLWGIISVALALGVELWVWNRFRVNAPFLFDVVDTGVEINQCVGNHRHAIELRLRDGVATRRNI